MRISEFNTQVGHLFTDDTRFMITGFTLFGKPLRPGEFQAVSKREIASAGNDFNPEIEYIKPAGGDNMIEIKLINN